MSADGAALNPDLSPDRAIERGDFSPDLAQSGALPNPGEVDVLRNSLSAVMLEYHEQSKKFATAAADHARQSQEIAALTAQNLQLSRELAARADAAARCAAAEAERDGLRSKYSELKQRLFAIESSTLWFATRRLRAVFARHPRLRRFVRTIRLALARP